MVDSRPVCHFFSKHGGCRYGGRCRYSHGPSPLPAPGRAPPAPARADRAPPAPARADRVPRPLLSSSAGYPLEAASPLLARFPRGDPPPERRAHMLARLKARVVALARAGQGRRAAVELSDCLDAWGFAGMNQIENLCICAAIGSAQEFIAEVLALS